LQRILDVQRIIHKLGQTALGTGETDDSSDRHRPLLSPPINPGNLRHEGVSMHLLLTGASQLCNE
jgi:hypothetical protein